MTDDVYTTTDAAAGNGAATAVSLAHEDQARADTYRLLGRLLAGPPDETLLENLANISTVDDDGLLTVAWQMLATSAERTTAAQAADEYQALFIGLGRGELVPYASWYLTGFLMEKPLAQLRADMRRLGFELQDDVAEPEDHAAALCEIMSLLAADEESGDPGTQAAFFEQHIAPWMARFFGDLQQASSARFYRAVGQLGEHFIKTDQRYLAMVEPTEGAGPLSPVTS